jgi:nucleotide-binding universal stress UspA family protein
MQSLSLSAKRVRTPIKRILIPTDGSDASYNSVLQGVRFAAMLRAEVIGIHAVDPKVHPEAKVHAHGTPFAQIRDSHPVIAKEIEEYFLPFRQLARTTNLAIQTTATVGEPIEVILQAADVVAADAIVMGTHGASKKTDLFAGSVARGVFSRAKVPVLVLPPNTQIQTEGSDKDVVEIAGEMTTRPRILVGIDGGPGSIDLAAEAMRFARVLQAELYFMHAGSEQNPEALQILDALKQMASQYWIKVKDVSITKDPVDAAIEVAERDFVDFFMFGTRLRLKKGLMAKLQERAVERGSLFFGSTSDQLVRKAERPVLIVHLADV